MVEKEKHFRLAKKLEAFENLKVMFLNVSAF